MGRSPEVVSIYPRHSLTRDKSQVAIFFFLGGGGLLTWHRSADGLVLDIYVNTAVSKLESVLFAPLQGFPCLGSFAGELQLMKC